MVASSTSRPQGLSNRQKTIRTGKLRAKLALIGATLLKINWNKRTAHFITKAGQKKTAYAS